MPMRWAYGKVLPVRSTMVLTGCAFIALITNIGCGNPARTPVEVRMGNNNPGYRILSFELVVKSVQLISTKGTTASLLARPLTIEHGHLGSSVEVVAQNRVPRGIYRAVEFDSESATVVFVDNFANIVQQRLPGRSLTHLVLNPAITVDSAPSILRITLNIPTIIKFDATRQRMVRGEPAFAISQGFPTQTLTARASTEIVEPTRAIVTAVHGSSFTVRDALSGVSDEFSTDQNTIFDGVSLLTMNRMLVQVAAKARVDGKSMAEQVKIVGTGSGSVVVGTITNSTSTQVASQQVYGRGASVSLPGSLMRIDMSQIVSFTMDSTGMNVTNLTFDASNLVPGQRMQFISSGGVQTDPNGSAGLLTAGTAQLEQQSISGTIANVDVDANGNTVFDLNLPADRSSVLSILGEGTTFVHIVTQPLTTSSLPSLAEGMPVKVHGLLLFASQQLGSGTGMVRGYVATPPPRTDYSMLARTITQ